MKWWHWYMPCKVSCRQRKGCPRQRQLESVFGPGFGAKQSLRKGHTWKGNQSKPPRCELKCCSKQQVSGTLRKGFWCQLPKVFQEITIQRYWGFLKFILLFKAQPKLKCKMAAQCFTETGDNAGWRSWKYRKRSKKMRREKAKERREKDFWKKWAIEIKKM